MKFTLMGGPHHRKTGWYHGPEAGAPPILHACYGPSGVALVVSDPESAFATGPFVLYHHTGNTPDGVEVYNYVKDS